MAQKFNKSEERLCMERISNFAEIQGDLENFAVKLFDFTREIWSEIATAREFLGYDSEAYELSYTDPDADPVAILGERPEISDWDEFMDDLRDRFWTLKAVLRRPEIFIEQDPSKDFLIGVYKDALEMSIDLQILA